MVNAKIITDYVYSQFKLKYKIDNDFLSINYSDLNKESAKIKINSSGLLFFNSKDAIPKTIYFRNVYSRSIPFLFGDEKKEVVTAEDGNININSDIIASAFYFLSGWQERYILNRDEFGRFPYEDSIQKKYDLQMLPVVNYYFLILKEAIEKAYGVKIETKIKEKFCCFITHDIDELETIWLQESFQALKKKDVFSIFPFLLKKIAGNDLSSSIESITSMEEKRGVKSTFFFLVRKGTSKEFKNADYDISKKKISKMVNEILNDGYELGLHGSFFTHDSKINLQSDKKVLTDIAGDKKIYGNRFHYLCFDISRTPLILSQGGFQYDTTLGFAEYIGFRNSYSDPFYLFDWENQEMTGVLEFPQTVMDVTLYFSQYMNISQSESLTKIKEVIDQINFVNGCLILNWHNTSYLKNKNSGWDKVLDNVIDYCISLNGIFFTFSSYISKYFSGNNNQA